MNAHTRHLLEVNIVTTSELAALTGIPMVTLQKWVERGQVDCVKKGRTYLFDKRDFAGRTIQAPSNIPALDGAKDQTGTQAPTG